MKRKIKISIAICLITYLIFTFARTMAVAQRGNTALGGEIMLFLIPAIIWIVYRNSQQPTKLKLRGLETSPVD